MTGGAGALLSAVRLWFTADVAVGEGAGRGGALAPSRELFCSRKRYSSAPVGLPLRLAPCCGPFQDVQARRPISGWPTPAGGRPPYLWAGRP